MNGKLVYGLVVQMTIFTELIQGQIDASEEIGKVSIVWKTCDHTNTFKHLFGGSFKSCIMECQSRKRCAGIMYHRELKHCSLKDALSKTDLAAKEPLCIYTERSELTFQFGPCSKHECGLDETCVESSISSSKHKCVKTECSKPPGKSFARLISNLESVGHTNRYICNEGYAAVGNPSIRCQSDGIWSQSDFQCLKKCEPPKMEYSSAELVGVDGEGFFDGTVITFKCREGYRHLWELANSTCKGGFWSPRVITCCQDNSTELYGEQCIQVHEGGLIHSYNEAIGFCKLSGGDLSTAYPNLGEHAFKGATNVSWLLSRYTKTSLASRERILACVRTLAVNSTEAESLLNADNYTYNNLVDMVRDGSTFPGSYCVLAHMWENGQPDEESDNSCTKIEPPNYKLNDMPCAFPDDDNAGFVCYYNLVFI